MKTSAHSVGSTSAEQAFARADWNVLLPKLWRRGQRLLTRFGWGESGSACSGAIEARELVNAAVLACLEGERTWVNGCDATEDGLRAFLGTTMRSLATNLYTKAAFARRAGDGVIEEPIDGRPSALRVLEERSLLERIERALEGDEEALALHEALVEDSDSERGELAEALGWEPRHVTIVRWRIARRLASNGITLHDPEDEAEPPSSSPSWRDHEESQSPGERRRLPPEHARRAGGPGRGR
jgi:hypothetical protein